jgi:hypothetical protein
MILNMENLPLALYSGEVEAGNIYQSQKGQFWLVVCVNGNGVSIVVYDKTGLPQSVQRYARSYLSEKRLVGKVELPMLDVTWEDS